jgi:AcrR family transcriptional regulator
VVSSKVRQEWHGAFNTSSFTRHDVYVKSLCIDGVGAYARVVPRLWNDTIDAHRAAVRDATLDATAALVAEHGLTAVTMSQIAKQTGIGRATLYKYFPDVDAILAAWHERQITAHLRELAEVRDRPGDARQRLEAVLTSYALNSHAHHGGEVAAVMHRGEHVARAHQHLRDFIAQLIIEGTAAGQLRADVPPDELAGFCLHALTAAGDLPSKTSVRRLIEVTLDGLRPAQTIDSVTEAQQAAASHTRHRGAH